MCVTRCAPSDSKLVRRLGPVPALGKHEKAVSGVVVVRVKGTGCGLRLKLDNHSTLGDLLRLRRYAEPVGIVRTVAEHRLFALLVAALITVRWKSMVLGVAPPLASWAKRAWELGLGARNINPLPPGVKPVLKEDSLGVGKRCKGFGGFGIGRDL